MNKYLFNKDFLSGLPIVKIDHLFESNTNIPKRKSKNKRIQKKLIRKYGYSKKVNYSILFIDNKLVCHSRALKRINELTKERDIIK